jgi:DNA-directed RNA polymerase specialized sigma24 family protein
MQAAKTWRRNWPPEEFVTITARRLFLFHESELSCREIAGHGVPLGTVKTWVHRARRG